jgi:hypothetical protein
VQLPPDRVLAEVRQAPTALPDKLQIPVPGALTQTHSNDDFSFTYPQNWQVEGKKRKGNSIGAVDVYPSDAKLGSWVTRGFFVGHYSKYSSEYPQTQDGASDLFLMLERQKGLTVATPKTAAIGDSQDRIATYTSPSVLNSEESGWLIVVKDKNEGFYWIELFWLSNDDTRKLSITF